LRDIKAGGDGELAARIAEALRTLGFFIYQRGVDDPAEVTRLLHEAGVSTMLEVLMAGRGIYVVLPSEKACRGNCRYRECREAENQDECIEECMERCMKQLAEKAADALERMRSHAAGPR